MSVIYAASQPSVTTAEDLFTPLANREAWVDVTACNVTGSAANVSIGLKVGSTTRWLINTLSLSANSTNAELKRLILDDTMTIVVQTGTASAIDFTVNGYDKAE